MILICQLSEQGMPQCNDDRNKWFKGLVNLHVNLIKAYEVLSQRQATQIGKHLP